MSFDKSHRELYDECLKPVIEKSGFAVDRGDELLSSGAVLSQIEDAINHSDVVLAELSESNMNVYFEVGYARALHKPLVLVAKRGVQLPFDVGGLRVLYYDDSVSGYRHLRDGLEKFLRTSIG